MGKGKQIESGAKNLIIKHFQDGKTYRDIGKILKSYIEGFFFNFNVRK